MNEAGTFTERLILKSLGSVALGDRYDGKITYENGILVIGPDEGWYGRGNSVAQRIQVY